MFDPPKMSPIYIMTPWFRLKKRKKTTRSINNWMGPYQWAPLCKLRSSYWRYSGFFGVRSAGPTVGDFLDKMLKRPTLRSKSSLSKPAFFGESANRSSDWQGEGGSGKEAKRPTETWETPKNINNSLMTFKRNAWFIGIMLSWHIKIPRNG